MVLLYHDHLPAWKSSNCHWCSQHKYLTEWIKTTVAFVESRILKWNNLYGQICFPRLVVAWNYSGNQIYVFKRRCKTTCGGRSEWIWKNAISDLWKMWAKNQIFLFQWKRSQKLALTSFSCWVQIPELHIMTRTLFGFSSCKSHYKWHSIEVKLQAIGSSLPGQVALTVSLKICHVHSELEEILPDKIHPYITLKGQCSYMPHTITFTLQ